MGWFWLLFLIAVLFIMLLFPVTIHLRYSHGEENEHLSLRFSFLCFSYSLELPRDRLPKGAGVRTVAKGRGNRREGKDAAGLVLSPARIFHYIQIGKSFLDHVHHYEQFLRSILKWFHIAEFSWHTEIGTGEADSTGVICGLLWTIKGSLLAVLSCFFSLHDSPWVTVSPRFQEAVLSTRVSCIIRFSVGQAMTAGIRLAYFWLREGKAWRNIQSKA